MKIDIEGNSVYVDGYLNSTINEFKKRNAKDWDTWLIISGDEGDGKSVMGKQLCKIFAGSKFTLEDIVFTPTQFTKRVLEAEKGSAIMYDEAISGLSARRAMSGINTALISMAAQCRKKNLFVLILLPSFFDLDKNIAIHRTRGLIHVLADVTKRGFFRYYTKNQKKKLYVLGKKFYNMNAIGKSYFRGRFTSWDLINVKDYEAKKDNAINSQNSSTANSAAEKYCGQRNALFFVFKKIGYNAAQIVNLLESYTYTKIGERTVQTSIKNVELELKTINMGNMPRI